MENEEVRALLEGMEDVWKRVSAPGEPAQEAPNVPPQPQFSPAPRSQPKTAPPLRQPRWFAVF